MPAAWAAPVSSAQPPVVCRRRGVAVGAVSQTAVQTALTALSCTLVHVYSSVTYSPSYCRPDGAVGQTAVQSALTALSCTLVHNLVTYSCMYCRPGGAVRQTAVQTTLTALSSTLVYSLVTLQLSVLPTRWGCQTDNHANSIRSRSYCRPSSEAASFSTFVGCLLNDLATC